MSEEDEQYLNSESDPTFVTVFEEDDDKIVNDERVVKDKAYGRGSKIIRISKIDNDEELPAFLFTLGNHDKF